MQLLSFYTTLLLYPFASHIHCISHPLHLTSSASTHPTKSIHNISNSKITSTIPMFKNANAHIYSQTPWMVIKFSLKVTPPKRNSLSFMLNLQRQPRIIHIAMLIHSSLPKQFPKSPSSTPSQFSTVTSRSS